MSHPLVERNKFLEQESFMLFSLPELQLLISLGPPTRLLVILIDANSSCLFLSQKWSIFLFLEVTYTKEVFVLTYTVLFADYRLRWRCSFSRLRCCNINRDSKLGTVIFLTLISTVIHELSCFLCGLMINVSATISGLCISNKCERSRKFNQTI